MLTFRAHKQAICGLAFAPDGRHFATSGREEQVALWDLAGPTRLREFDGDFEPPVAFSPDGRFLARGGLDFALWEVETGTQVVSGLSNEGSIAFAPDGSEVAVFAPLSRWALSPDTEPRKLRKIWGTGRGVRRSWQLAMAYSPDGELIATSFLVRAGERDESRLLFWDRRTARLRRELTPAVSQSPPFKIVYSPDGTVIAGLFHAFIGVFDATTGATVATLKPTKKHFRGLAFTPDASRLIAVNHDARVRVYDTATWAETTGYEWNIGRLTAVAVAPDGLRAAAGSDKGQVVVWDLEV